MNFLTFLIMAGLVATGVSLVLGIRSMAHGGESDRKDSVRFMSTRVVLQGVTLLVLLVALGVANL